MKAIIKPFTASDDSPDERYKHYMANAPGIVRKLLKAFTDGPTRCQPWDCSCIYYDGLIALIKTPGGRYWAAYIDNGFAFIAQPYNEFLIKRGTDGQHFDGKTLNALIYACKITAEKYADSAMHSTTSIDIKNFQAAIRQHYNAYIASKEGTVQGMQ